MAEVPAKSYTYLKKESDEGSPKLARADKIRSSSGYKSKDDLPMVRAGDDVVRRREETGRYGVEAHGRLRAAVLFICYGSGIGPRKGTAPQQNPNPSVLRLSKTSTRSTRAAQPLPTAHQRNIP